MEELLGFPEYNPGVHEVYIIKLLFSPVNLPFIIRSECQRGRDSAENLEGKNMFSSPIPYTARLTTFF